MNYFAREYSPGLWVACWLNTDTDRYETSYGFWSPTAAIGVARIQAFKLF